MKDLCRRIGRGDATVGVNLLMTGISRLMLGLAARKLLNRVAL
jgi:hypothetical protein